MVRYLSKIENFFAVLLLGLMVLLAAGEAISRQVLGTSIPGATVYVQQFNLLLAFVGAVIAARGGRHLSLSLVHAIDLGRLKPFIQIYTSVLSGVVLAALTQGGYDLVLSDMNSQNMLEYDVPNWWFEAAMAAGFGCVGLRIITHEAKWWQILATVVISSALLFWLSGMAWDERGWLWWPGLLLILGAVLVGAPIFVAMGGVACLLFFREDISMSAVPLETYHIVSSATLPVIPLFTFVGYLLANGEASKRLVRLFTAAFGWLPGGVAAATVLVCAFFTTFTGASGVTILGLGGLLLPILVGAGYTEAFALGLITTAGSLGMLFPPSLPVILYGVVSHTPIDKMFIGGILPGVVLIVLVAAYGVVVGLKQEQKRQEFSREELIAAIKDARYELLLPVIVFTGIFGGLVTLTEAAAITVLYVLLVEVVLNKKLTLTGDVPAVMVESATVVGGLLIIFGVALGLTSYMVDAEIPMQLASWVKDNIEQRWIFILAINFFLLVVGSLMEGFSAIVILVPLIAPIGESFGFNPVHLGILFLANLELGFLLPPVGLNLFLSSLRFQKPLSSLYKPVFPFFLICAAGVLLISYVPALTTIMIEDEVGPSVEDLPAADMGNVDPTGSEPGPPGAVPILPVMPVPLPAAGDSLPVTPIPGSDIPVTPLPANTLPVTPVPAPAPLPVTPIPSR